MINTKDIITSKELGKGFLIFQNEEGYFVGFLSNGILEISQQIDRQAYRVIEKSQMGGLKNGRDRRHFLYQGR